MVKGLPIGRSLTSGKMIRERRYCHTYLVGQTGSGKGVSFIVPIVQEYRAGSLFVNDPKGELVPHRKHANVHVIDPFGVTGRSSDCINPLDWIDSGDRLFDDCRAAAEAMVVRAVDGDKEPHFNNAGSHMIATALVGVKLLLKPAEQTLASMRELLTDHVLFQGMLDKLNQYGGMASRMAGQVMQQMLSENEFSSIRSTAAVHTQFLDSLAIERVTSRSSMPMDVMRNRGNSVFFVLPVEQLEAQRNFQRLVVSLFLRDVMRFKVHRGEALFLLDECASLGSLEALGQAFQLGRGSGVRLYTAWQSLEQSQAAFKQMPNLVMDNSDTKVFIGPVSSLPTAQYVSQMLGNATWVQESANSGDGYGYSHSSGQQTSWGSSYNRSGGRSYAEASRPLLYPPEVMRLPTDRVIAFCKGVRPIMARRILYYRDRKWIPRLSRRQWVLVLVLALALFLWIRLKAR